MHEYQRYREIHLYKSNDATYPAHFHSHCEMMFVEKGQVNVIVDGETYTAKQNKRKGCERKGCERKECERKE